ncbi:YggS family pyridoxal phosphate-dependent enzyme [Zavarzinia sp.]|uniref:YggS family pyridoxal phosphate-dependent enzyme n=1 Tax=Zavarzinia sp. TaxID=2027920 RepID=UPI003566687B
MSTIDSSETVADRLAYVEARIAKAERGAGRPAGSVRLVAVSKTHEAEAVREAIAAGQRRFGENRVQEAEGKFPALKAEFPDLELHLIGPLQTNKVKEAVALFDVIETVDREKLAAAIARASEAQGRRPRCFVQVNTGEEPQKAGCLPGETDALVALCRDTYKLDVVGLMCIPPVEEEPSLHFALLGKLAARNGLSELSMGMSHDYETAVRLGATYVRVGTAIFGARAYPTP